MSLEDVASVVDKGPFGFYAKDGSLRHHFNAATWKLFDKVGYALQQVPESMVRSNNGMNGKPLWIQVGDDVFDISSKISPSSRSHALTDTGQISLGTNSAAKS